MIFTFGTKIILLLLLIGGTIAIAGNYIGRAIGRRRLTVFKLRPRHTAYAITILSGILIVFTTMGVILIVSQDARTALFGLEELRRGVTEKNVQLAETKKELAQRIIERTTIEQELTAIQKDLTRSKTNLARAKREIAALEKTKEKLGQEVEVARKGRVLFKVGEVLLTSLIQAGPEKDKLEAGLRQILSATDTYVRSFGIKSDKHLVFISPEEFDQAVAMLAERRGENIISVTATRNTLFGEEVPIRLEVSANTLIYKAGEKIAEAPISPSLSVPEIEQEIKRLLAITHLSAKKAGVLPDASGTVGNVPYARIFALAKKIKSYKKGVNLRTFAKENTYAVGPLEVDFKIFYQ
ncbi:MAG: DUF3084 domain-containing protein [Candidatus Margulisiibacteriota bacterium]